MTSRDTLGVRAAAVARGDAEGVRADVTNGDMLAGVARFDRGHFEGLLMAGFWGKGLA